LTSFNVLPEFSDDAVHDPGKPVAVTGELVPAVTLLVETVGVPTVNAVGAVQVSPIIGLVLQKSKITPFTELVLDGLKVTKYDWLEALGVDRLMYSALFCTWPPVGKAWATAGVSNEVTVRPVPIANAAKAVMARWLIRFSWLLIVICISFLCTVCLGLYTVMVA
jgi:hypothetical protein